MRCRKRGAHEPALKEMDFAIAVELETPVTANWFDMDEAVIRASFGENQLEICFTSMPQRGTSNANQVKLLHYALFVGAE